MVEDILFLRQYELFANLRSDQLRAVVPFVEPQCFYPDQILCQEGQPAETFYLLVDGNVEVLYAIAEEGPARVDKLTAGNLIGCSALVPPHVYTSTARTLTEVEVLAVDVAGLRGLSEKDPRLVVDVQQHIIRCLLEHIVDMRLKIC
jgi:CRP-like cAMP-binding protein